MFDEEAVKAAAENEAADNRKTGKVLLAHAFKQKRYIFGVIGLGLVFAASFFVTQSDPGESQKKAPTKTSQQPVATKTAKTTDVDRDAYTEQARRFNESLLEQEEKGRVVNGSHSLLVGETIENEVVAPKRAPLIMRGLSAIRAQAVHAAEPVFKTEINRKAKGKGVATISEKEHAARLTIIKNLKTQRVASSSGGGRTGGSVVGTNYDDDGRGTYRNNSSRTNRNNGRGDPVDSARKIAESENRHVLIHGLKETLYTRPVFAVNSDVKAAVILEVVSGRFRGATLKASFEVDENMNGMRLNVTSMALSDGDDVPVEGIGLDEGSTLAAVKSGVNRHYLSRYAWWGLGTALEAAKAAALANSTIAVVDGAIVESRQLTTKREIAVGLGSLGSEISSVLKNRINRPPTYYLKRSDPVVVFFLSDVEVPTGQEWVVDPKTRIPLDRYEPNDIRRRRLQHLERQPVPTRVTQPSIREQQRN